MEEKRIIRQRPADYAATEKTAKDMDKKSLEEYYILDKDKRHNSCSDSFLMTIGVLTIIFFIGVIGFTIGLLSAENQFSDNLENVAEEICTILGEDYSSAKFFESEYIWPDRIICNKFNSKLG